MKDYDDVDLGIICVTITCIVAIIGSVSLYVAGFKAVEIGAFLGAVGTITGQILALARGRKEKGNDNNDSNNPPG